MVPKWCPELLGMESFQRQFNVVDKHPQRCTGKSEDGFKMFSVVLPEENDNTTKKAFKDFIETDSVVYLYIIYYMHSKKQWEGPHGQNANPAFATKIYRLKRSIMRTCFFPQLIGMDIWLWKVIIRYQSSQEIFPLWSHRAMGGKGKGGKGDRKGGKGADHSSFDTPLDWRMTFPP